MSKNLERLPLETRNTLQIETPSVDDVKPPVSDEIRLDISYASSE